MIPNFRLVTAQILSALAALPVVDVGDGEAPAGDPPFVVLYPLGISEIDSTLSDPNRWASMQYQITVVGTTREQAEDIMGDVQATLIGGVTPPAGYAWRESVPYLISSMPVTRDDSLQPPSFMGALIYQFTAVGT